MQRRFRLYLVTTGKSEGCSNANGKRHSTRLKRDACILSPAAPAVSGTHLTKAVAERGNTVMLHGLGNGYWLLKSKDLCRT